MTAKYTLASNTTVGDRTLWVNQDLLHLSTGDAVFLEADPSQADPNKVALYVTTGSRASASQVAILSCVTSGTAGVFKLFNARPQCLALCRDGSDNLYVIGAYAALNSRLIVYQAFTKLAGLVWQPGVANVCTTPLSATIPPVGYVALWCATGGGSRYPAVTGAQAGHILVACGTNDTGVASGAFILDAGKVLAGVAQAGTVTRNPAFLGSAATLYGSNLDIEPDGFGAANGVAISASPAGALIASWGVTSTGALTSGAGLSSPQGTATLSTATKLRIVQWFPGLFAAAWPSPNLNDQIMFANVSTGAQTVSVGTDSGSGSNVGAPGATLNWDIIAGDAALQTVYFYSWSLQASHRDDMLRRAMVFPSGNGAASVGATVIDDTNVPGAGTVQDGSTIRCVKSPVDWFLADWQGYDLTSAYSLVGDYSVLPVQPDVPTLLTPANNAPVPLATAGTLTWSFASPEASDVQVTYYFRRHNASGYQWWNGSAFTTVQAGATGGNEVAVTSGTSSVTFGSGKWAAGVWTWTVQVTGSSGVASGYAPEWTLTVVAQPATPTLTATYDSANNRVTLTVAGTGTDHAWFEYSDDGTNWFNVYGATSLPMTAGAATTYDYWAPPGATRSYRVAQFDPAGTPGNVSLWSSTHTATPAITTFWLRFTTGDIGINPHVAFGTLATSFGRRMTEHNPPGRADTVIVSDSVIGLEDGGCTFFSLTADEEVALMPYLLSLHTLLLQSPDNRSWFICWNGDTPVNTPYIVRPGSYRDHAVTWRGQATPPA